MLKVIFVILKCAFIVGLVSGFFFIYKLVFDCSNRIALGISIPSVALLIGVVRTFFKKEFEAIALKLNVVFRTFIRKRSSPFWRYWKKRSEQSSSLSLGEIQNVGIIKKINYQHIPISKEKLANEFAKHQLIRTSKVKDSAKILYTFDYEMFFGLSESYLRHKLCSEFYERYCNQDFEGIAFLSGGRSDYSRIFADTTIAKESKIENAIKETIYWEDIILEQSGKAPFFELQEGSKVILLQLMEEGKEFLEKAYEFVRANSNVEIMGLLTFFSPLSKRSSINDLTEEVLIELTLP